MLIDMKSLSDEALQSYDAMMIESGITVKRLSGLAMHVWSEVLKELDSRGQVKLISGSYDSVGSMLVQRLYQV
jgi:hypothetical protein